LVLAAVHCSHGLIIINCILSVLCHEETSGTFGSRRREWQFISPYTHVIFFSIAAINVCIPMYLLDSVRHISCRLHFAAIHITRRTPVFVHVNVYSCAVGESW
jgi:hypothetical protein